MKWNIIKRAINKYYVKNIYDPWFIKEKIRFSVH